MTRFTFLIAVFAVSTHMLSQEPAAPPPPKPDAPQGQVLFHRNEGQSPEVTPAAAKVARTSEIVVASITDAERSSLTFTAWDLDLHMTPATSQLAARARFTVRNTSFVPLKRIVLQLSSTLHWESIAASGPLAFTEHTLATDADHTGEAMEAVVTLPHELAPGETITLTALYSGTVPASAARLTRIGAPPEQASRADWDQIAPDFIGLRGFGNVLWYPVSEPALFLGDGAKLFQAVGRSRRQQAPATLRVRLSVEYAGDPPIDGFLNGQRQPAEHIAEEPNALVAESHGVATVDFPASPVGFRTPSLFVTWHASRPSDNQLLSVITERPEAIAPYTAASVEVAPLLRDWLGAAPLTPLTLLDHPGQPFEDDAFLALPLASTDAHQIAPSLVHSLAHAWFRSSLPWLNEGVPQFMALVASEATDGRDKALAEMRQFITPLTLVEPERPEQAQAQRASPQEEIIPTTSHSSIPFDPRNLPGPPESYSSSSSSSSSAGSPSESSSSSEPAVLPSNLPPPPGQPGQSLIAAHDEVYYRAKAAAVLFMLRSITGDAALKQALQRYRDQVRHAEHEDPHAFERVLEQTSHKDLAWVFDDWVYNDRGLADLSIVSVTPRDLPARNGKDVSWLVAAEIHNAGSVAAEVPVTVRSGTLTSTERIRVPAQSTISTRIVFEGVPQELILNDGTVPETTAPMHIQRLQLSAAPEK